jgi:hypothetical protein
MSKMQITSDARQKLRKIQNGDVFDSPTVFVTELMQNSYRARAKNVYFYIDADGIGVVDDGVGARSPKNILTLDYSEWESTDEGFGIGFWSVLAIPMLQVVQVRSKQWTATIDVPALFETGVPEAEVEHGDSIEGFYVTLISPWFRENTYTVKDAIRRVGETQPYNVYLNGELLPKRDIQGDVDSEFRRVFTNPRMSATIGVTKSGWEAPMLYYERREVGYISDSRLSGITGIIEMTPKSLNLKEPDRTSVVKNDKLERFVRDIVNEARQMYLGFLEHADDEKITRYADVINKVVPVDMYEKVLLAGNEKISLAMTTDDDEAEDETYPAHVTAMSTPVEIAQYEQANADVAARVLTAPTHVGTVTHTPHSVAPARVTLKDKIRAAKKKVWIRANELDKLAELKAKAEYYGITVFVAKNILHEQVFQKNSVSHITALEDGIVKRNIKTDVTLKTDKEINFIRILQPIARMYNLPENTFMIGNLHLIIETNLDGKTIDREKKGVAGVRDGDHIVLDRKTLGLKRFHLYGSGFGQHELKALMANLPTIAHELAHLLYNTTDNTVNHYQKQDQIYDEIVKMYLTI